MAQHDERSICWLNGELLPARQAVLSVFDHGLLYGDGVFEGIRFYRRRAFRLRAHLTRLERSARAIALTLPYGLEELSRAVEDTVAAFSGEEGYLRLVVTRGEGPLGLDPTRCGRPNVFIIADRLTLLPERAREQGARLIIAATRRLPSDGLDPRIKSLNYLNHILARIEAHHAGADEAVLLNGQGRVAEGTADNLFIVREGTLQTPPVTEGALDGITRGAILELAQEMGIAVREIPLSPYDLYISQECFLTGTGAELVPVQSVDGRPVRSCPGPVFRRLAAGFRQLVERETQGRF